MKRFILIPALLLLAAPVSAQEDAAKKSTTQESTDPAKEKWEANAGLNAIISTGNSSSQTVGGTGLTSYKKDKNKVEFTGEGAYGRARDNTTDVTSTNTKNWKIQLRYDRFVSEPVSLFALGHIGADIPAGFDLRYGAATGVAHALWRTDPHFFKYEVGFDYTREDRTAPPDDDIYSGRLFLQYKLKISEWATFGQDLENLFNVEEGDDIRLNSLTSLTMKLTQIVAFKAGFSVKFDNVPVPGKEKTDTQTTVGLVFDIL